MKRLICVALILPMISIACQSDTKPAADKPATAQPVTAQATSQPSGKPPEQKSDKVVIIDTSMGKIVVELNPEQSPITVKNFLRYVDENFYSGTIFHRVIKGFMIQGGGHTVDLAHKEAHEPIKNESQNGPPNARGTISMARMPQADSASCEFFINLKDNPFLNYPSNGGGYCVFGKVIEGMDVVDQIAEVRTKQMPPMFEALPVETIKINSITRK